MLVREREEKIETNVKASEVEIERKEVLKNCEEQEKEF